jgi:hypothetical protein
LAGRKSTISPAGFLAAIPSWRPLVAVTVRPVFVPVVAVPALIVVPIIVFISVLVFVLVPMIGHQHWRA